MKLEVYCDESRQELFSHPPEDGGQWVVLGSLWVPAEDRESLKAAIRCVRDRHSVYREFKWHLVSPSRLGFYRDLVELFFKSSMRFRCLVLPAGELDAAKFHQADSELMFYKFYYLMLQGWILPYNEYQVFLDIKTSRVKGRLATLRRVLQNANLASTIASVQALPSHELDLMQLTDVLMGATSYRFHRYASSPARLSVVKSIETRIGHQIAGTPRCEEKFNVFQFRPGGGW
ncbi:MAG: DUF3800 domain-containing protein [candidate division WS1 bacterium]|nr:DUF3800 domain-containing protein [candidate division WS1 bacterium]